MSPSSRKRGGIDLGTLGELPTMAAAQAEAPTLPPTSEVPVAATAHGKRESMQAEIERLRGVERELATLRDSTEVIHELPVTQIRPSPFLNRSERYFASARFAEIRDSIREHGLQIPVRVRPVADGTDGQPAYELIYGASRLRAHTDLGLPAIRAIIEPLADADALRLMEVENRDRQDLSALERAQFYARMLAGSFGGDRQAMQVALKRSNAWISLQLTIASMPPAVFETWPALAEAPSRQLVELGRLAATRRERLASLLAQPPVLPEEAGALVQKLLGLLERDASATPGAERVPARRYTTHQGKTVASLHATARGVHLSFASDEGGFAEYLYARLEALHRDYLADPTGDDDPTDAVKRV